VTVATTGAACALLGSPAPGLTVLASAVPGMSATGGGGGVPGAQGVETAVAPGAAVEVTGWLLLLFAVVGLAAGFIDAVVGGGGLIQVPALLLIPGIAPVQALGTNKLGSIMGVSASSLTYYRRLHPDLRTAAPMALVAFLAAIGGAGLAAHLPADALQPLIVVALILVAVHVLTKPKLGQATNLRWSGNQHYGMAVLVGAAVGFYDGFLGPGAGSFFVIGLVSVLGYAFLPATALAKMVNFATNVGALVFFIPSGAVLWQVGLVMGVGNVIGAYLGARTAVARGSRFVRVAFVVVVSVLIVKLVWDMLHAA